MRFLIVGFSSIVARRALPALLQLPDVESIDIASRRPLERTSLPDNWSGKIYDDYREAISNSQAEVVYVSLVNSLHEEWVAIALRSEKHVIVDKPAFLSLAAAVQLIEIATKNDLCLAEAVVFSYHPQIAALEKLSSETGGTTRLIATFTIPPLHIDNFRNHPELGGGSLWDLGPYAAAASRLFFGSLPEKLTCNVVSNHPETNVDTGFSVLASYNGGRSYVGQFGFDTEYQNWLTFIGPGIAVTADRIFTAPPNLENQLEVSRNSQKSRVPVKAGDSFELFFRSVISAIDGRSWSGLAEDLMYDARMLDRMRVSARAS